MNISLLRFAVLAVAFALLQSAAVTAAPFDPEFKIERIAGECSVKAPGAADFVAAEAGKAYPYGTEIKTGAKSSAVLVLSQGNECQVLAGAQLVVTEKAADKKFKRIRLVEGRVDVALEKDFQKSNGFDVETPTAICGAVGSKLTVASKPSDGKLVDVFSCTEGLMNVADGQYFSAPDMDTGDQLSVTCPNDRSYLRLRNSAGEYELVLTGPDGAPRRVKTKQDTVVIIHVKKSATGDKFQIAVVVEREKGKTDESWSYEKATGEEPIKPTTTTTIGRTDKVEKELQPSDMPTPTTTTTTIPSPTPVGER